MCAQKGNWIGRKGRNEKEEMAEERHRKREFYFSGIRGQCAGLSGNCKVFEPKRDFSSYPNIFFVRSFGLRSLKYILDGVIFDKSCFY